MSRKILLADDSLTIQKVVELTFMEGDFEVTAVSNGDDALGKLDEMSPDIVIADVHMPGADGFQICRATREPHPGVPVLLLVGTFEPFEEEAAAEVGANAHLKKPFDSQELLRLVEDLLGSAAADMSMEEPVIEEPMEVVDFEPDPAVVVEPPTEMADEIGVVAAAEEQVVDEVLAPSSGGLSDEDVDRIARRVVELMGEQIVREISWDVIPDLAEIVIKDRIRELESQVE